VPATLEMQDRKGRPNDRLVERVVAHSIALSVDPSEPVRTKVAELGQLAHHDRTVLGRAWLDLVVPALRGNSHSVVEAERLLAAALEAEGSDERIPVGAGAAS